MNKHLLSIKSNLHVALTIGATNWRSGRYTNPDPYLLNLAIIMLFILYCMILCYGRERMVYFFKTCLKFVLLV